MDTTSTNQEPTSNSLGPTSPKVPSSPASIPASSIGSHRPRVWLRWRDIWGLAFHPEVPKSKDTREPLEYLRDRVQFKIGLYYAKSRVNKWTYLWLATLAMIGSTVVPVLINFFPANTTLPTVIGVFVAVFVGLINLWHPLERWKNFEQMSDRLRGMEMLYSTGANPYDDKEPRTNYRKFVKEVESVIAQERAETTAIFGTPQGGDSA